MIYFIEIFINLLKGHCSDDTELNDTLAGDKSEKQKSCESKSINFIEFLGTVLNIPE